jgi:O-antigen ligase
LLFAFTVPFEDKDLGIMSGSLSPAKICGLVLVAAYVFYHNPFVPSARSVPRLPGPVWCFLVYLAVYAFHGLLIQKGYLASFVSFFLTRLQLLVLLYITFHLMRDEKMARNALHAFSFASVILAIGTQFNILGMPVTEVVEGRVTALDYNPGNLAGVLALAAVVLVGLNINTSFKHPMNRVFVLILMVPLLIVMANTGTRGPVIGFFGACLVYFLATWQPKRKLYAFVVGITGITATLYIVATNPYFMERWQRTYYEGNVSGREKIVPMAIQMILEKPFFGWGPVEHRHELGSRLGLRERDAHNLFLHLLLELGLVGTIPFMLGLGLCARSAWRARKGGLGSLPLAALLAVLVFNLSETGVARKPLWLVLALVLASDAAIRALPNRKPGSQYDPRMIKGHEIHHWI